MFSRILRSSTVLSHSCKGLVSNSEKLHITSSYFRTMATSDDIELWFETAVQLAQKAGELISAAVHKNKRIEMKSSFADLVTETDKQVEDLIKKNLEETFPEHKFIGEESTAEGVKCELTDAPTWIIDPVDGTMNFVHSFPFVAVSIGLAVNKEIVVGIVYNPLQNRMFTAKKGEGAFCNGKRIQVSQNEELSQALLLTEFGTNRDPKLIENISTNMKNLAWKAHGMRSTGSAAMSMCTIAAGEADAYFETGIHCWDMAAGKLIVEEAGGVALDPKGGPLDIMNRRVLCANSRKLAEVVSSHLVHIDLERD